jgi:restriction system protein
MGLQVEWTAPLDRRHGQVDLVACLDPLGPNRRCWVVHLRHSGQALEIRDLEALVSGAHPANRVLCVSTAGFSEAAREYALSRVPDRLALVDLETFVDLWIGHYGQLSAEARSAFPLEAVHFLAWGD